MSGGVAELKAWEKTAIDAVGSVIEFWGFKRNQGRVWALLYLRDTPMSAAELQEVLALSKGAVSMITRELERWQVLQRERAAGASVWHYRANKDFRSMLFRVLTQREMVFLSRIKNSLAAAENAARQDPEASSEMLDRLQRMYALAQRCDALVRRFVNTAQLDARQVLRVLEQRARSRLAQRKRRSTA